MLRAFMTFLQGTGPDQSPPYPLALSCPSGASVPTAMVSDLTAQESETMPPDPTAQELNWAHWNRGPSLTCLPSDGGWYSCCSGTYVCQHEWHSVGISLPGPRMPWGTLVLLCCPLHPCALHPSGHDTDTSFLPCNIHKFQCPKVTWQAGTSLFLCPN